MSSSGSDKTVPLWVGLAIAVAMIALAAIANNVIQSRQEQAKLDRAEGAVFGYFYSLDPARPTHDTYQVCVNEIPFDGNDGEPLVSEVVAEVISEYYAYGYTGDLDRGDVYHALMEACRIKGYA